MSVFAAARRKSVKPACPSWAKALFLHGESPEPGTKEHGEWGALVYFGGFAGATGEAELWAMWKGPLLAEWVAERPGTRPPAWWQFEAPELRKVRPGQGVGICNSSGSSDGIPYVFPSNEERDGLVFEGELRIEGEAAYLKRLGLFIEGEARRVPRGAFADEVVTFGDDEAA